MKADIHPEYVACTITCSCGAVYHTHSTRPQIHIEICAKCHPFFTGQQRFVDTAGRVEKFRRKYKTQDTRPKTHLVPSTALGARQDARPKKALT